LLRACIWNFGGNLEDHLPIVDFTYNNNYKATVGIAPYKALYGGKYRTLVCWEKVGDRKLIGP